MLTRHVLFLLISLWCHDGGDFRVLVIQIADNNDEARSVPTEFYFPADESISQTKEITSNSLIGK